MMELWVIWAVIGVALIIAEMMSLTFYLLWIGLGAFAAGITALIVPDWIVLQVIVGAVVTLALTIFTKPLTRRIRVSKGFSDGSSEMIGQHGEVIQAIEVGSLGIVKVGGEMWSASATEKIAEGTKVIVINKSSALIEVARAGGM